MNRRQLLKGIFYAGVASFVIPRLFFNKYNLHKSLASFNNDLAIPPVLKGTNIDGVLHFNLNLQEGISEFIDELWAPTYGINGDYLGPVIEVNNGDKVKINVTNNLSEESTLHWHGLHIPAKMDGGPHQGIKSGETWSPYFTINQNASTQWFHSHAYHATSEQVYMGLAGLFYINDATSQKLAIPKKYGVDDIPLVIQDRAFTKDGRLFYSRGMHTQMNGMKGDHILVNGTLNAVYKVQKRFTRLRILNGSNARIYDLAFSDGRAFKQIASDGGFLDAPVTLKQLNIAPGERAEIVVEFSDNENVMLLNKPNAQFSRRQQGMMGGSNSNNEFAIMRFESKNISENIKALPKKLTTVRKWQEKDAVKTRRFVLEMGMMGSGITINGRGMNINRIDETVYLNDIEIWSFENKSSMAHPIHIHDIQFNILDRDGRQPPLNEQGLKDTVTIGPRETVRVITQFEHFADNQNPYMYHCHILEHEDAGMMGQFLVINKES